MDEKVKNNFFFDWIMPIAVAVIVVLLVNHFLIFQIEVKSGSMTPTLLKKDRLMSTVIYDYKSIKRGDIITFYSREYDDLFVKRVVGLPGENVDIDDKGIVYINGKKLDESYVKYPSPKEGHFKIPNGKYLMLGDDREISDDARYWKNPYIDKRDIKGKVRIRVFPFDRIGSVQ